MSVRVSYGDNPDFANINRFRALRVIVILVVLVFMGRLAQLQLIKGSEFQETSQAQAIKKVRIEAFRGNIFDVNKKLIVHNEPSFSLTITPYEFRKEALPLLASLLEVDTSDISKILKRYKDAGFSPFVPIKLYRDVSFNIVSLIEEYNDFLPGVELAIDFKRLYDFDGNSAHLLGYTKEISPYELVKNPDYTSGDIIGKSGLEKEYEVLLRGTPGNEFVAVNKFGKKVSSFDNGKRDVNANSGFDLHLSINLDLQLKAEKLLEGKRGSVVAIDPNTGEIIVFVCKPDYDPRKFSGRVPKPYYDSLANDESKPLLHRTVSSAYPPGSAWKMLVAIAGLREGKISASSTFTCGGGYAYGNRFFKCMHNHGTINVTKAIQESCNSFFFQLSLKLGLDKMIEYGKMFGFGSRTGVDIPEEKAGNYPSIAQLNKSYKGYIPKGLLLNYSIGQGEILVTPLQMASYAATLANGGTIYQPHIVKKAYNNITNRYEPINYRSKKLDLAPDIMDIIHKGMYDVVNTPGGTAYSIRIPELNICGKTSTAQNPHGKDHGWFICYAPKDKPRIAMAVMVENMGFGGVVAAPIAKEILYGFFYPDSLKSRPTVLPKIKADTVGDVAF